MFYDDIAHEFGEITQNKGHYAVQGHSRSPILVQIDFLLVINNKLPPILHHVRDIAFDRSKITILVCVICVFPFIFSDYCSQYSALGVNKDIIYIWLPVPLLHLTPRRRGTQVPMGRSL